MKLTEAEKQKRRDNYQQNKERYKAYAREWKQRNPEKVHNPTLARKQKMKTNYGFSWEQYEALFFKQNGKCKICGDAKELWPENKIDGLYIDHCHQTDIVRGLLCTRCNTGLGLFRDNPLFLKSAMEYLNEAH